MTTANDFSMKLKLMLLMWVLSFTCGAIFSSCGGGENDEPEGPNNDYESDYSSKILGIWYGCDDIKGFDLRFNSNGTVNVLIFDQLCSYKVEGNKLVVEKWTDLCGDILSIDENDMYLFCNNKYYRHFSRTDPNTGGDNGESGGGNNDDSEPDSSIKSRLINNSGMWYHKSSKSTQVVTGTWYYQWDDYLYFSSKDEIRLHIDWRCQRKNNSGVYTTDKSIVDAWGTYSIQGSYLICDFTNVICSGNNDIETKYWNSGQTNLRKYKIEFFNSGGLWLTSDSEYGNLPEFEQQSSSSNGGGSSNGSDHHYPCKTCDESGKCWNCQGSGKDPVTKNKCNTCHGSGKCQICQGKGYIIV